MFSFLIGIVVGLALGWSVDAPLTFIEWREKLLIKFYKWRNKK